MLMAFFYCLRILFALLRISRKDGCFPCARSSVLACFTASDYFFSAGFLRKLLRARSDLFLETIRPRLFSFRSSLCSPPGVEDFEPWNTERREPFFDTLLAGAMSFS